MDEYEQGTTTAMVLSRFSKTLARCWAWRPQRGRGACRAVFAPSRHKPSDQQQHEGRAKQGMAGRKNLTTTCARNSSSAIFRFSQHRKKTSLKQEHCYTAHLVTDLKALQADWASLSTQKHSSRLVRRTFIRASFSIPVSSSRTETVKVFSSVDRHLKASG